MVALRHISLCVLLPPLLVKRLQDHQALKFLDLDRCL